MTKAKANLLKESCVWCLIKCKHENGVKLQSINCEEKTIYYNLSWLDKRIDIDAIFRTYNSHDAIEYGAEAITLLLIREQTSYTAIRRAVTGTGIDYWLGFKSKDEMNFFTEADARLEISGILQERITNTVKSRIKKKLKQTAPTDNTFPVFISVIEFSHPRAEMVLKDAKH
ncbi:MAG: hypothetical protein GY749_38675 [Desulfobacteraceae bacterium]|nr:hypothetical protein [Desulfobacteraceae bacterium]